MNKHADIQALVLNDPSYTEFLEPSTPIVRTGISISDLEETILSCGRNLILFIDQPERASELKKNVAEAGGRLAKAIDVNVFSNPEDDTVCSNRNPKTVRIEHVAATSCLARGGLIIAVSRSSEDRVLIATLEHSRTWRIDVPPSQWARSLDEGEQKIMDIADQAAKCILQGKDVLFVVDGEAEASAGAHYTITRFLQMLVPQPKYILSAVSFDRTTS